MSLGVMPEDISRVRHRTLPYGRESLGEWKLFNVRSVASERNVELLSSERAIDAHCSCGEQHEVRRLRFNISSRSTCCVSLQASNEPDTTCLPFLPLEHSFGIVTFSLGLARPWFALDCRRRFYSICFMQWFVDYLREAVLFSRLG